MRTKIIASLSMLVLAGLLAPATAIADEPCETSIIIFSYPSGVNSQALVCLLAQQEAQDAGLDPRIINPASTSISVRYTVDLGEGVPTLTAVLDGLGFEGQEVTLTRVEVLAGLYAYDSEVIDLPGGPTSSGCVVASIESVQTANSFHTVDASCS